MKSKNSFEWLKIKEEINFIYKKGVWELSDPLIRRNDFKEKVQFMMLWICITSG